MTTDELINVIQHGNGVRAAVAVLKLRSEIAVLEHENERLRAEANALRQLALADPQVVGLFERGEL